ncbi:hypothetical protein NXS98_17115 [Fontisphaera persica]|uniref:hypothetical protein n=1 Tax=Fontisphaera persica TaxID=2974023 RepID=UPI0024C0B6C0|nr:hypothetical protein [Fontisphaera persica]WCJ59415.1 hypothetical protein NXS98_17115 [Fontisphaera persica]
MITPVCQKCRKTIPAEDVNVAQDVAFCRWCNVAYVLSELTHEAEASPAVDVSRPPEGASVRNDGVWRVIRATHRSWGSAAGLLFFCLFWNGIVSVFVLLALASTLMHLGVTLPEWFPAMDMKKNSMPLGMTIFLWIFLTPFILVGLGMFFAFLSSLMGHTEVRLRSSEGVIYSGIGPFKWPRRFVPAEVKKVRLAEEFSTSAKGHTRSSKTIVLELENGRTIKFGSALNDARRAFMVAALRQELANRL